MEEEYRLIGDIYDAALEPGLWPNVLGQIVELAEANSAVITALDTLNPSYTLAFTHNIPEEALRTYREAGLDAFEMEFHGVPMIQNGIGSTILSAEMYGTMEEYVRRGGDFYQRCLKPSNIHTMAAVLLDHGDFRWGALGIHRPEHWLPLTQEHAAFIGRLGPHIRRALQIHRQLTVVKSENTRLYAMLDALAAGVLMLDSHGRVRYANPSAERLLRNHDALQLNVKSTLKAAHPIQQAQLQDLIQGAIATSQRKRESILGGGVIGLKNGIGETPLMLTITPLSELSGYEDLGSDGIAAAIFLTNPNANHVLARQLLKQSYALSERESELCEAFVNHATLEGVAGACGLSLATVRTYIKGIYEKTGQHSQAELMRLLMGMRVDFEHIR